MSKMKVIDSRKLHDLWALMFFIIFNLSINIPSLMKIFEKYSKLEFMRYSDAYSIGLIIIIMLFVIYSFAYVFIPFFMMHASFLILPFVTFIPCLKYKNKFSIGISGIYLILSLLYYYYIFRYIRVSAAICKSASKVLLKNLSLLIPMLLLTLIAVNIQLFIFSYLFNLVEKDSVKYLIVPLFLQGFWFLFFAAYMMHVHVSSIIINYFVYESPSNHTFHCFRNTFYALGSVAFGSLLVALIITARLLSNLNKSESRNRGIKIVYMILSIFVWIGRVLLIFLEFLVREINKYVFVYIAIYGKGYISSIAGSFRSLTNNTQILKSSLCSESLSYFLGFFSSIFVYNLLSVSYIEDAFAINVVAISIFASVNLFLIMFDAAVNSFLFTYNMDPEIIREKYPETFDILQQNTKNK